MDNDTIVAIATPLGSSLQAIIRLSGPGSFRLVEKIFSRPSPPSARPDFIGDRPLTSFPSFSNIAGYINLGKNKVQIPATLYLMKSPYSYTREDVAEIHTIGATPLLDSILSCLMQDGARLAQPGEFTKRAFLNGRIDLTQAEAVLKLIRADSDRESRLALNSLNGRFAQQVNQIQQQLIDLISRLELNLDFSDQEIEIITPQTVCNAIKIIGNRIRQILASGKKQKIFRNGVITALAGRPNAGKSSLFNRLVPDRKTIVTPLAGTTRDVVEGKCLIGQTLFRMRDGAGLTVNRRGKLTQKIRRLTLQSLNEADLFILLLDGSQLLKALDKNIFKKLVPERTIVVLNKNDLPQRLKPGAVKKFFNYPSLPIVSISARTGQGIAQFKKMMRRLSRTSQTGRFSASFLINTRQSNHLKETLLNLKKAGAIAKKTKASVCPRHGGGTGRDEELLAIELREALAQTGAIVGQTATDDILNHIFADFCIGK